MPERTDVLVVGAGFAGLYAVHALRAAGLSVRAVEAGNGVGGTWHWNRYPGARCDIESNEYCYSFDPQLRREWQWLHRYPAQPEIERYLNHVADRYELRPYITLGTSVTQAVFGEDRGRWLVRTDGRHEFDAKYLLLATGNLSVPRVPDLPGIEAFTGQVVHPARWPADGVELAGRRVGIVGTGSSGVQLVAAIAAQVARLFVFQRSAAFAVPAWNGPATQIVTDRTVLPPPAALSVSAADREVEYERRWQQGGIPFLGAFADLLFDEAANATGADFVRRKIAAIVADPARAQALSPRHYPLGAKRICVEDGYYAAFNRRNVTLVDLRAEPLVTIFNRGVRTAAREYKLDLLICATGYDAFLGAVRAIDLRGRGGRRLAEKIALDGPHAYLGTAYAGFPNCFLVTGAGSPSVLVNMVAAIEQHVDWITACIQRAEQVGACSVEVGQDAERRWSRHVTETAEQTLLMHADSWYVRTDDQGGAPVCLPYPRGLSAFRERCDLVAADGYRELVFHRG